VTFARKCHHGAAVAETKGITDRELDNPGRARRAIEQVCSGRDLAYAPELYDERFVDHINGMTFEGLAGIRDSVGMYRAIFSDLRFEVDEQVSEGDRVASRWTLHGTYRGRNVTLQGITISRFAGGRIVEDIGYSDTLGLVRQLGLLRSVALGISWLTGRLKTPAR
jgi:predicted ester cyclase